MSRWKRKFNINERKEKRKGKNTCRRTDFQECRQDMKDDFLKQVFEHLQSQLEDGESLYRLNACHCDGLMKLKDGNILIEIKGGELNWGYQCTAITELMVGSKLVRDKWNEIADEHWIIAEDFTSGQNWDRTLDYPLETHRFIKDAVGFEIHLLQFKDGQLTEIVSMKGRQEEN